MQPVERAEFEGIDYGWVMQTTFVLTILVGAPVVAVLSAFVTLDSWGARAAFAVRVGAPIWFVTAVAVALYARRTEAGDGGVERDENGDGGVERDENGDGVVERDENGDGVVERDENGDGVVERDENGDGVDVDTGDGDATDADTDGDESESAEEGGGAEDGTRE